MILTMYRMMALCGAAILLSGCATLVNSPVQAVMVTSTPSEAKVTVDDMLHVQSPGKVTLSRLADHVIVVEKEGYQQAVIKVERSFSHWTWLNIFCTIFVYQCWKKDKREGGYYTFDDEIDVTLTRSASAAPAELMPGRPAPAHSGPAP